MTQEEKELLLKYLCMALPYGVICYNSNTEVDFKLEDTADIDSGYPTFDYGYGDIESVRPYLRPMSSMTEEEHKEYEQWLPDGFNINTFYWLLKNHFDFMGLIPKGSAIEVTKENNPYENGL